MRRDKTWWSRGLGAALLVPLLLWLSGCWLFQIPPTASFTVSVALIEVGGTINFSAIRSEDQDGTIVSYEWDFGDGTDGTGRSVSHTYTALGTFTVVLRVTDDDGLSATTQRDIYVEEGEPAGPQASFTASPTTGGSPLAVYFDASASSYTLGPLIYTWDFGDGSTGYGKTTSHLYVTSAGRTYTVTLRINAPDGQVGTTTGTVTVSGPGTAPSPSGSPSARFDIAFPDTNEDVAPLRALFDPEDSEADDGRVIATYTWSFGDGDAANSVTPQVQTHVYVTDAPSEIFSVTLVVIDDEGATDDLTKTVKAYNYQPVAGFEILDTVQQPPAAGPPNDPDVGAIAGNWVDDDVLIDSVAAADVRVWIRSQRLDNKEDGDWTYDQDTNDPEANGSSAKPAGYDDHNFSFDPEGQTWTAGTPAWFPNPSWGIKRLWVNWDDGNVEIIPFVGNADTTASHTYPFDGTVTTYTITVTAEDHLGAEASFSRDLTLAP